MKQIPISVVILTFNEEVNLRECILSVRWSDDIVVYDSISTDQTTEIASQYGARVFQRNFDNYASQRNAALKEVNYKYDWILMLDCDERITPNLRDEMNSAATLENNPVTLYRVRRKDMFMGKWIRHSSGYPTWFARLLRKGHVTVLREINEEYQTDGNQGQLQEHMLHYPFNKGMAYWFERHNRYSSMEALALSQERQVPLRCKNLFSTDPVIRRKFLKQLAYRLPGRPLLVFFYLYLVRLGFLDGIPGLNYSVMRSIYEYMIDLKIRELSRK